MPPGFEVLQQAADAILPFEPWATTLPDDRSWDPGILPIARLKPGVSLEQARSDIAVIAARLAKEFPENDSNVTSLVDRMQDQIVQNSRPVLLILVAAPYSSGQAAIFVPAHIVFVQELPEQNLLRYGVRYLSSDKPRGAF